MALAAIVVVALIALAVTGIMLWGAFEALARVGRAVWHFLAKT